MSSLFLPSTLPLLPIPPPQVLFPYLRVSVVLPSQQLALVLTSIADNARNQKVDDGARLIAVVPVVEIERRVGRWATAARVVKIEKAKEQEGSFRLVLEGLARIRLPRSLPPVLSILPPIALPISTFSLPLPDSISSPATNLLPIAQALLPKQLHLRLAALTPSMLCDLLVTVLGFDWETRVDILGRPEIDERSAKVKELLYKLMESRGITPPAESDITPIPSTSTALIRRPRGQGNDQQQQQLSQPSLPEDLQPIFGHLTKRLSELTPAVRSTIVRELTRLAKIPPQSAEYGVGKTYIEWLLALPWKKVDETSKELDLDEAKRRLEQDHEGLQEVKRRVVEYLAVYRQVLPYQTSLAGGADRDRLKKRRFIEEVEKTKQANSTEENKKPDKHQIDPSTAGELLHLIPSDEKKALQEPTAPPATPRHTEDEGPPKDVFRDKGPILLLVGPPGVGKTSIARSLADALGRKFHRISLGGVRDEAEIRGHRRTYVGALPGMLVQALRKVGTSNPLILLDELDKVGTSNFHGDPSAALLETLDPAQNWSFHDHYLGDVPIDLSQVMFIATANTLETISPPLLDRCEVIECSGYVTDEKLAIARKFLLPRQVKECGLEVDKVDMADEALLRVILDYTQEAGVRSLERELGKVCRTKAVQFSTGDAARTYDPKVTPEDVEHILGMAKYDQEVREERLRPGVATGMAYRGSGMGGILLLESTLVPGGKGKLVLTGSLGDVIKESAELSLTWVKSHAVALGITSHHSQDPLKDVDIHLHFPSGAVKKDGPSAGTAIVLAFVSLLTGRSVPSTLAVTGEMTLRGAVTAVGGIKEKVLGAHRAGIKRVLLPERNRKDVHADLPESLKRELDIEHIGSIEALLEAVWGREIWVGGTSKVEARL